MKPLFDKEKKFLEKQLNILIPDFCWREGKSIYLNTSSTTSLIDFKVINGKLSLKKNLIHEINKDEISVIRKKGKKAEITTLKNYSWQEEIELRANRLHLLYSESYMMTKKYILENPYHELIISVSGGKDSDLTYKIVSEVLRDLNINDYVINYFNTTNEVAITYKYIKEAYNIKKLRIVTPEKGLYNWLAEDKNWYLPSVMSRTCCSKYKEGQLSTVLDKKKNYITFLGARKHESAKRSEYDWDLNAKMKKIGKTLNSPENWKRFLPIVEWTDVDVWLYILKNNMKYNFMYELGYNRVGCLICPYQTDYIDILTKEYFSYQWDRWEYALKMNYKTYNVATRLKWSFDEWKQGKWKKNVSKEYEIIQLAPTPERIKNLAQIKGISIEMASKYFKRKCTCCNKKLNPDEIAMNLKILGRFENISLEDELSRQFHCKKCMCKINNWKSDDYKNKVIQFRSDGCELF